MRLLIPFLGACACAVWLTFPLEGEPPQAEPVAALPAEAAGAVPLEVVHGLVEEGQLERAEAILRGRLETAETGELVLLLSRVARLRGDIDSALAFGERAVQLLPDSSDAHYQYGRALAERMRRGGLLAAMKSLDTYKREIRRAVELDPGNVEARVEQIAFHLVAPSIAGADLGEALEFAEDLVVIEPRRGAQMLAWVHAADDRPGTALATCRAALERFPDDQDLLITLAGILLEEKETEAADAAYELALAGPEGDAYYNALYQSAKLRIREEFELDQALVRLEKYLEGAQPGGMLPSKAAAYRRIGNALEGLGRRSEAAEAYRHSLRLEPDYEKALDDLDDLLEEGE